ncbi:hypothetical protein Clacol_007817 [Clathrus columnatus]|uniref:Uncharacterized protein n=1 Tax=Clathrus columnatus TaxID=1419009 RepID=A0AAV5AFY9_9AGAM|nr:hypothetical protein Clacol_007817 [Clathrus columnatus]
MDVVMIILLDLLAFIVVIRRVWGLWKLKRGLRLLSNSGDLVTSLLEQGLLRFAFRRLSSLLICEFTLDLRRRNATKPIFHQSAMDLPTLSFRENPAQSVRTVLGRLHESIVAEMGESNDVANGSSGPGELDNSQDIINSGGIIQIEDATSRVSVSEE